MPGLLSGARRLPLLRVERVRGEVLVIICDDELLGKKFEEGDFILEVERSFYEGRRASVEECLRALENATIANIVGSMVEHAIKAGFVNAENVIRIGGIPHAQIVKL